MKKIIIIILMFLTLLTTGFSATEYYNTSEIELDYSVLGTTETGNLPSGTFNAVNSMTWTGTAYANSWFSEVILSVQNTGLDWTGTIYIKDSTGTTIASKAVVLPDNTQNIITSFDLSDYSSSLFYGDTFSIVMTKSSGGQLRSAGSTQSYSGTLFDLSGTGNYDGNDATLTKSSDNIYDYIYSGNQSISTTKNDGTLSGYSFNDGILNGGVSQHSELLGTLENGVVWSSDRGLEFDGVDDYVDLGSSLNSVSDVTICSWFSTTNSGTQRLINFQNSADTGDRITLAVVGTELFGRVNGVSIQSTTVNDGIFHYACLTYGSTDIKLYLDGSQIGSTGTVANSGVSTNNVYIGTFWGGASFANYFDGTLDNVIILNTALNSSQVSELYETGKTNYEDIEHLEGYEFNFNEGSGTSTTGRTINGKFGKALSFDGVDDYVDLGDVSYLDSSSQATTCGWFKLNSLISGDQHLIEKWSNDWMVMFLDHEGSGNSRVEIYWKTDLGTYGVTNGDTNTLNDFNWHYVCTTYNSGTGASLFIDGSQSGTTTSGSGNIFGGSLNLILGATDSNTNNFDGSLDEVRIWNTALTQPEILLEMNSQNPVKGDGLVASYSMNEHQGNTTYDTNHIVEGNISKGIRFDGVDDYVDVGDYDLESYSDLTFCGRINSFDTSVDGQMISQYGNVGDRSILFYQDNTNLRFYIGDSNFLTATNVIIENSYIHFCGYTNGTEKKIYINGELINSASDGAGIGASNYNMTFGASAKLDSFWKGAFDDVRIYNTSLSPTDISNLYNKTYYNTSNLVAHYSMEEMQNSLIHDRNNQLCVGCQLTLDSKTLAEGTYTQWNLEALTNYTSSQFFMIDLTNPDLTDNLDTEYNDGYTINLTNYITYSDALSGVDSCVVNFTTTSQTSACNNESFVLSQNGNVSYTILLTDNSGNTNTSTGVLYINPNQYFSFYDMVGLNMIQDYTFGAYNDTAGLITIPVYDLGFGAKELTFNKLGYPVTNVTFTFNSTSNINLTTNLTQSKIIVTIFDRDSGNILTGLTDITLVSTTGFTGSTSSGYINISDILFIEEEYQVIAEHSGFSTETVFFDFTNQENLNVNLYLLNNSQSDAGTITIKVLTNTGALVNEATCSVLEWKPSQNAFISIAQGQTNINGETVFNIEIGTKLYKFSCTKSGVTSISSQQIIQSTGGTLPIILTVSEEVFTSSFDGFSYTFTNTSYNSTHQRFTYTFADSENLVNEGCLKWYKVKGTQKELLDSSCAITSIGQIQEIIGVNNTYTLVIEATAIIESSSQTIDTKVFKSQVDLSQQLARYNLDLLLPLLFAIIGMGIGYSIRPKNIYLGIIGVVIGAWLGIVIVPTVLGVEIVSFISVIGILMLWGGYTRK